MRIDKTFLVALGLGWVAIGCDQLVRAADTEPASSSVLRAKGPATGESSALRPFAGGEAVLKTCFPCHQAIKERDLVFTRCAH